MLEQGLVFVLGAGFSAEVGLPLGGRLKHDIVNLLPDGDSAGNDDVRSACLDHRDVQRSIGACKHLRRALPLAASIDNLVEHLSHDDHAVHCAKVGIAAAILRSERQSKIFGPAASGLKQPSQDSAFGDLFRLIVGRVPVDRMDLAFNRVKVVNFNYDRCFEQFMTRAVMDYSGVSISRAREIVAQATILHPYGSLGPLTSKADFGQELGQVDLIAVSEGIKTFSEEIGSLENEAIRELLKAAQRLVFMGCAYHQQNLDLLRPSENAFAQVYGTMYSPPPADQGGHAVMSMAAFNEPAIAEIVQKITDWPRRSQLVSMRPSNFRIEALSNQQLIARYGPAWVE